MKTCKVDRWSYDWFIYYLLIMEELKVHAEAYVKFKYYYYPNDIIMTVQFIRKLCTYTRS